MSPRHTVSTTHCGASYGDAWDDQPKIHNIETAAITKIDVRYGKYINSLTVHYAHQTPAPRRGGTGGTLATIALDADEFVTLVEGRAYTSEGYISRLSFASNKGKKWGPYGSHTGTETFTWDAKTMAGGDADMGARMGLLWFNGSAESHIGHLRATFAVYPGGGGQRPSVVRYEAAQQSQPAAAADSGDGAANTAYTRSKFALSIMSPTVTLHVGTPPSTFHTSEAVLTRLPFFRAALTGAFKEAATKVITMPDDDPGLVAALIEFLYMGTYTYTYTPGPSSSSSSSAPSASTSAALPECTLTEATYHTGVLATASKYDFPALRTAALDAILYSLQQLRGIEIVRALKGCWDEGCGGEVWSAVLERGEMEAWRKALVGVVKGVYAEGGGEMGRVVEEGGGLVDGLLRLAVGA